MLNRLICVLIPLMIFSLSTQAAEQNLKIEVGVPGWFEGTQDGDFEVGTDIEENHNGKKSGYIKSLVEKPKEFGNLSQAFAPTDFLGKRLKISTWVKAKITSGSANCWARVDGKWSKKDGIRFGSFDNMTDRPIAGTTDWTKYDIVVDVPEESTNLSFGCMLIGTGHVWIDDFSFEVVSKETPLTGISSGEPSQKEPFNINFEEEDNSEKAGAINLKNFVYGWNADHNSEHFEIGIDSSEKHSGRRSAFVKSLTKKPPHFGNIDQGFIPTRQLGKRIRMSAWVKTKLTTGRAQLWLRSDQPTTHKKMIGRFDNMYQRPIKGVTDWTLYELVCEVPTDSDLIAYGLMIFGEGQAWVDDVTFESVGNDVPLTGENAKKNTRKTKSSKRKHAH